MSQSDNEQSEYSPWERSSAPITKELLQPTEDIVIRDDSGRTSWSLRGEWQGGDNGSIIEVVCNNDSTTENPKTYIMKYIPFYIRDREQVMREITLQHEASLLGVSIPIIDSWFTESGGVMVMDKLDIDVGQILTNDQFPSLEMKHLVVAEVMGLLVRLNSNGICHGDVSMTNVMARWIGSTYRLYLIDFGEAFIIKDQLAYKNNDLGNLEAELRDLQYDFPSLNMRNLQETVGAFIKVLNRPLA